MTDTRPDRPTNDELRRALWILTMLLAWAQRTKTTGGIPPGYQRVHAAADPP